ncbi:MAG: SDR family NAD(P)-dependent oxidoreductase, partial [Peptococcaceae bacterium]|nr:SDR family NAD(P)-dependent oxidoreductase [Peptococcaceae bacterium]
MVNQKKETFLQKIKYGNYIVRDHLVHGIRTLPGVTLLDMVYRLAETYLGTKDIELRDVLFNQPVVVSERFDKHLHVTFTPGESCWKVTVASQKVKDGLFVEERHDQNMECLLLLREDINKGKKLDVNGFINNSTRQWDMDDLYALARKAGINHYSFMKTRGTVYQQENEELMRLQLSEIAEKYRSRFYAHPAFLDGSTFAGLSFQLSGELKYVFHGDRPYIPFTIKRFCINRSLPSRIYTHSQKRGSPASVEEEIPDLISNDITVFNEAGDVLVEFEQLTLKRIREPRLIERLLEVGTGRRLTGGEDEKQEEKEKLQPSNTADGRPEAGSELVIASYLKKEIGRVLRKSPDEIDEAAGFYELGLDSTHLLGFVKTLEQKLGRQLYPTLLFEYPSIHRLSDYLLENHGNLLTSLDREESWEESVEVKSVRAKKESRDCKMLYFKPFWKEQEAVGENQTASRRLVVLYDGPEELRAVIKNKLGGAGVVLLNSQRTDIAGRFEDKFIQLVESIQKSLQDIREGKEAELLVQVVAGSGEESVSALAVGGLLRTAFLENPRVKGQVIVIDRLPTRSPHLIAEILQEEALSQAKGTLDIHYRGDTLKRHVRQLMEVRAEKETSRSWVKEGGVYVITGGMGGLGLLVAGWLAGKAKTSLALIGRSRLDQGMKEKMDRLAQKGARVLYLEADISREADAARAIEAVKERLGPVTGVIHCAGIIKDQLIITKTPQEIRDVFQPKVRGICNLDEITKGEKLDFFVVFSSISAVMGNLGQADYASANAFMDHFTALRQEKVERGERYGKTVAVNWPLWSGGGMRIHGQTEDFLFDSYGLKPLPPALGLQALELLLSLDVTQTAVFYGDERKMRGWLKAHAALIEESCGELKKTASVQFFSNANHGENFYKQEYTPGDIAVIGMSGRYPQAESIERFYRNLKEGKDCITGFPKDRWKNYRFSYDVEQFYRFGGFLERIDCFDPLFFNISPRQAEIMDPQARLFLETAWEACEDAGFGPNRKEHYYPASSEKSVGVFAGVFWSHYELFGAEMTQRGKPMSFGIGPAAIANWVSYCLNFHGPSMAVDTMCSSSLTAIHLACDSLRKGECHYAVAGGVNLVTHPHKYIALKKFEFLASDGRCRSFGEGGDGYVPGEGVGAVLLTTLERAEKEGYHIYGVIKGSSLNHVGKTSGATVPDPVAQSEVIADALTKASVNPRTISYLEAHGTGTALGDPIEVQGLRRAFERWTTARQFCAVGSCKSNIGHLEAAAGIAGFTKVMLQFKHQEIFPSLHSEKLNPHIPFPETPFYVERSLRKWERPEIEINGEKRTYPRRAGISSFGANGSNAHVIVEEYIPKGDRENVINRKTKLAVVPLSARNEERLKAYAEKLLGFLRNAERREGLDERVREDIMHVLSTITSIRRTDLDPAQDFSELNVGYPDLAALGRQIQEKWRLNINDNMILRSRSVNDMVTCLLSQYGNELSERFGFDGKPAGEKEPPPEVNLDDLAYTFQVGRETMENRVAFAVQSIDELVQKLEKFVQGEEHIDNCFRGDTKKEKELLSTLTRDEDMKEALEKWINKGKITRLLDLWTKGLEIDWEKLYGENRPWRVSLPTYPFARERYWAPEGVTAGAGGVEKHIHPLLHKNTSDLMEQRYSSTFTGQEFFLADHRIKGRRVLPAAAQLEMARAAVEEAAGFMNEGKPGIKLKNVAWLRPLAVGDEPKEAHICVYPKENGEIAFEIYGSSEEEIYSSGTAELGIDASSAVLDIEGVKSRCRRGVLSAKRCYEIFESMGIEYGPGHRGLEEVYTGEGEVLAKLRLPEGMFADGAGYVLHPCLVDAAFQAALGLEFGTALEPAVPFALRELEI